MSIRISKKHGVNPTIPHCFFCQKPKNEVILAGKLPGDEEAPRGAVWDRNPCDECRHHMETGIIFISVKPDEKTTDNPYRTGGWVVIKEEAVRRIVKPATLADDICKKRVAFVPDDAWDMIGLPRE